MMMKMTTTTRMVSRVTSAHQMIFHKGRRQVLRYPIFCCFVVFTNIWDSVVKFWQSTTISEHLVISVALNGCRGSHILLGRVVGNNAAKLLMLVTSVW